MYMRIAVYTAMTTGVIVVVTSLVLVMLGYRFNRDTSSIEQGGLVQFASRPNDATVTIGSAKLAAKTPSKITINPDSYNVQMAKAGYKSWNKNVNVSAGEVLWLNYAQLVPEKIETKEVNKFTSVAAVKSSPNGGRLAVLQDASKPTINFVDLTTDTPKQESITLPASVLRADAAPTISLGDWAGDSDRLLVNVAYGSEVERLVVDRRDAEDTINISTKYQTDITEVQFDPRSSERLVIRSTSGEVRTVDTGNDTLSSVIASSVSYMAFYGNDALLIAQKVAEGEQAVGYISLGSDTIKTLKRVQSSDRVVVSAARYFSEPHIAVATGSKLEIFNVATLPSSESDSPVSLSELYTTTLPAAPDFLSIRSGGRFVFAQYASGVATYDIELEKQTLTAFNAPVSGEIRWLDRYHFYITNGTSLDVMEFDGGNPNSIVNLSTQFDAVQSSNGTFIYTVNVTKEGFAIQQSRMILK